MPTLPGKLLTEVIGTGLLTMTIAVASTRPRSATLVTDFDPVAVGTVLTILVYMGGHVSGANYNPAVTLALLVRGKISALHSILYICSQIVGAFLGGLLGQAFNRTSSGNYPHFHPSGEATVWQACVAEAILTFALANVVLRTATLSTQAGNSYYGLAIGFTVLSGAFSVGGISGGCFNPAVAMLNILSGKNHFLWVYLIAPTVGGLLAGLLFRITNPEECTECEENAPPPSKFGPFAVEYVGTFLLCFTVATAAAGNAGNIKDHFAPMAIGSMLMAQVFAGGPTSGAHYNPAVTLGVLLRFRFAGEVGLSIWKAFSYVCIQCFAAFTAGYTALFVIYGSVSIKGHHGVGAPYPSSHIPLALLAELIGTFTLVLVVLNVATSESVKDNSFFGLAIGFTVQAMAFAFGDVSGGGFNPAVGLLRVVNSLSSAHLGCRKVWIYWVAPLAAAVLAALVFHAQSAVPASKVSKEKGEDLLPA